METKQFGARLRELRKRLGMTQRELAELVGVDFSYLSKIESGVVPPPSQKVISRIAMALKADENELITLAGRIPPDIAQTLKNSRMTQRLVRVSNKIREGAEMSSQNLKRVKSSRILSRVAISLVMVMVISASLWFASPVSALTIQYPSLPTSGTLGSNYSFSVTINIDENEHLPLTDITAYIYKADSRPTYEATLSALPLGDGTKSYTSSQTGGGAASVTADATSGWLSGYRYGYSTVTFEGSTSDHWGYGYGYGYGGGTTSITYDITWTSPSSWPSGTYKIDTKITANGTDFTKTSSSITLSAAAGGGGGTGLPTVDVMTTNLFGTQGSVNINRTTGAIASTVTATSADGNLTVTFPAGTKALTKAGAPVSSLRSTPVTPPAPPTGSNVIGLAYDFGPDGATFDPPIEFKFTYDPATLPAGVDEEKLVIAYFDLATNS
jgi:transcriptional regulator with XRE-family HTH domain